MDKSEEKPSQSGQATTRDDDDCYILNLDSSSSEESFTSGKEPLKRPASCVVIDSESEDESSLEKKKVKIWEVSSEDEAEENLGTGKQPTIPKPEGVIVIDDNGKSKISVKGSKVKEGKSSDKGLILKIKQEVEECAISQYSATDDDSKKVDLDPELEILTKTSSGGEDVFEVEQPVKRGGKTKNVYVYPGKPGMSHVSSLPSEPDVPDSSGLPVFPISPEALLKTPRGKKKHPPK